MFWILLVYALFVAQGGIYRDQLFDLQDQHIKPVVVQSVDVNGPASKRQANVMRKSGN